MRNTSTKELEELQDLAQNGKNTGYIEDEVLETDLYFGSNDRVEHNTVVEDRNWLPYYSEGEMQIGTYFDTMGCVSFSALNIVEAKINFMIAHNLLNEDDVHWLYDNGYMDEEGRLNLSDRFTVAMSGTTAKGNTGGNVWWSIRNHGVVPESMEPWDRGRDVEMKKRTGQWYRDNRHISQESKDMGQEWRKRFEVFYERVATTDDALKEALMYSPVHVYIPTACKYDENDIQQFCGAGITHAVSLCDDLEPRGYWPLFDHYIKNSKLKGQERYIRRVVQNYPFYASGYVCTIKTLNYTKSMQDNKFVRVIKDKNSKAVGFWLPAHTPELLENMAALYGKNIPRDPDGGIAWDALIEGELELKN